MFRLILITVLVTLVCARAPYVRVSKPTLEGKIVGGVGTTIEKYPYQIALLDEDDDHSCGGSLIARNVVVTAAHCTHGNTAADLSVRAGSTYHNKGGVIIGVKTIHDHPKYKNDEDDYDVSVLVLKSSFTLSNSIKLIPLQAEGAEVPDGTLAAITGWGLLKSGGTYPDILQFVQVPKVNLATCKKNYPNDDITYRMHCFGYAQGGKDACLGDSGGPAVVGGKLVGVISWARGCALPNRPGVYVKVSNREINKFIKDILAKPV